MKFSIYAVEEERTVLEKSVTIDYHYSFNQERYNPKDVLIPP